MVVFGWWVVNTEVGRGEGEREGEDEAIVDVTIVDVVVGLPSSPRCNVI